MTAQLRAVPTVPANSPAFWWLLRDRASDATRQTRRRVFRMRHELAELRGDVRELEYRQESLLRAMEEQVETTRMLLDSLAGSTYRG